MARKSGRLFAEGTLGDLQKEAAALQKAGYATDPFYARSLVAVFNGATMQHGIQHAADVGPQQHPQGVASARSARSEGTLQTGERGAEIRDLQMALAKLGYRDACGHALEPDGKFGDCTKEAVQAFQRAHGIDPVGIVGSQTRAALHQTGRFPTPVDPAHPDHALHRQGMAAVHRVDANLGHARDEHSERLEASVTWLAKENGLTRIDHVVMGGGNVFVVQGGLDDPARRVAHMPIQAAVNTTAAESFRQLAQHDAQRNAAPDPKPEHVHHGQTPFEHHEGARRVVAP